MSLLSINVSAPKEVPYEGKTLLTGIYKEPIEGQVMLHTMGLDGDGQADLKAHGGTYKAVYVYSHDHYASWSQELGRDDFSYGQFGENFTVQGMLETDVLIGSIYRLGDVLVQVTQPRVPCFKLAHKMGIPTFVKTFMQSERTGFYLRVLEEGNVRAGDTFELVTPDPVGMSVRDIFYLLYFDKTNIEQVQRAVQIEGMTPSWIESFQEILGSKVESEK